MPAKAKNGKVMFQNWRLRSGLDETVAAFASLDELFELCLQDDGQGLVDRVVIQGEDRDGNERIVTLEFQSVTVTRHPSSES